MNDTPETSAPQPAIQPAAAPVQVAARPLFSAMALVALLIAALALAAAAWSWSDSRERIRDLKTELGRRLAESGKDVNETRLLARNADDAMRQVSEKVAHIESQMATSQQQQLALEALYKDLAQGRDQWTLAEIEQVLLTAAQQLQLAGNVKAAIIALEGADTRLQRLNKPQFTALRRAIATDLANLRAVPSLDEVGASARIEALVAHHASWPLASAQVSEAAPAPRTRSRATDVGQELWTELKRLVADPPGRRQRSAAAAARSGLLSARESAPAPAVGAAGAAGAGSGSVPGRPARDVGHACALFQHA